MTNSEFVRNLLETEITYLARAHTAMRKAARAEDEDEQEEYERQARVLHTLGQEVHERRLREQNRD